MHFAPIHTPFLYLCSSIILAMRIESNKEIINRSPERVYQALLNFMQNSQPPSIPQISNWTVEEEGVSFSVNNMIHCRFRLVEQQLNRKVGYAIETDQNMAAQADVLIEENGSESSNVQIVADAEVPLFMQGMIRGMVEKGLNEALARVKEMTEN